MCTYSMIADHYQQTLPVRYPNVFPQWPSTTTITTIGVSRAEFDALKRDVEDMKALLAKAKDYDERTGQPDCEMAEKVALLKRLADAVGINLDEAFGAKP